MSRDDLERLVAETFDAAGVPGGVLHVVDAQGPRETVEYGGLAASDPVTLGSTSKALAATVLLQLAEEGLVDLHAPVQRYLPGVGLPQEVTLLDLAHHRSGLRPDARPAHLIKARTREFRYANQNYNLLGNVLAAASGMTYASLLTSRVLEPLGMDQSWCPPLRPGAPGHVAVFGVNIPVRAFNAGPGSWIQGPSGAVTASAADAGRFLAMMLGGGVLDGRRVLSPASVTMMLNDVVQADGSPAVAGPFGDQGEYGLGWVRKQVRGRPVHLRVGKVPGATSVFVLLPDVGLGFVLLVNAGDFLVGTPLLEKLAENVARLLLGEEVTTAAPRSVVRRRRAVLNSVYAVFLVMSAVGWLVPVLPGGLLVSVGYHAVLPAALVVGLRRSSSTPWPWLFRFAPDVASVLFLGCVSMVAAGMRLLI